MRRTTFICSSLALLARPAAACAAGQDARAALARIERGTGGRMGVAALDTGSGRTVLYRADERFPMCSTFKLLAVAAVLARVDRGKDRLAEHVAYSKADLLDWAPVAKQHVGQGYMTLNDLCAAAIEYSDNTAANVLLRQIGGPAAVTAYARSLGDAYTRLDRTEPSLNTAIPGDPRDTTTPAAMAKTARTILFGHALSLQSRRRLQHWLVACRTGENLLRAGLPSSWRAGDKTGLGGPHNRLGDSDTRNDVAFAVPPGRAPIVIAAYLTQANVAARERDAALASVGRIVAAEFATA